MYRPKHLNSSKPFLEFIPREESRSGSNNSQARIRIHDPWIRNTQNTKRTGGPLEGDFPYPVKRLEKSKSRVSLDTILPKVTKKSCLKQLSSKPKPERMVSFNSIVSYHETWQASEYDRTSVPMATVTWKDMLELRLMRFDATRQAFAEAGLALPPTPPLPSMPLPPTTSLDSISEEMQSLSISDGNESQKSVKNPIENNNETPVAHCQPISKPVNTSLPFVKSFTWNVAASDFVMSQPQVSNSAPSPEIIYQNQYYRYNSQQPPFFGDGPAYSYFIQPVNYGFTYQHGFTTPVLSPFVAV